MDWIPHSAGADKQTAPAAPPPRAGLGQRDGAKCVGKKEKKRTEEDKRKGQKERTKGKDKRNGQKERTKERTKGTDKRNGQKERAPSIYDLDGIPYFQAITTYTHVPTTIYPTHSCLPSTM